jgi:hypothetical protein
MRTPNLGQRPPPVSTHNHIQSRLVSPALRLTLAFTAVAAIAVLGSTRAVAATGAPVGLPGPPPLAMSNYPTPPVTGVVPPAGPAGSPATVPAKVGGGPGLLSGVVRAQGRQLTLQIACSGNGSATVSAAAIAKGTLARGSYTCASHRAAAQLKLSSAAARELGRLKSTLGHVKLGKGSATMQYAITLESRPTASPRWSDGGLVCSFYGTDSPMMSAPNFTVQPPAVIDIRPWIAFYTANNGWRWLGTAGLNQSLWYRGTATPTGVTQWRTLGGALNRWTWAPITVRPGSNTYAIGVFEVVYWYTHMRYVWEYTSSLMGSGAKTTYCSYS